MGKICLEFIEEAPNLIWCCNNCKVHISHINASNDHDIETCFGLAFKFMNVINLFPS